MEGGTPRFFGILLLVGEGGGLVFCVFDFSTHCFWQSRELASDPLGPVDPLVQGRHHLRPERVCCSLKMNRTKRKTEKHTCQEQ